MLCQRTCRGQKGGCKLECFWMPHIWIRPLENLSQLLLDQKPYLRPDTEITDHQKYNLLQQHVLRQFLLTSLRQIVDNQGWKHVLKLELAQKHHIAYIQVLDPVLHCPDPQLVPYIDLMRRAIYHRFDFILALVLNLQFLEQRPISIVSFPLICCLDIHTSELIHYSWAFL